MCIEAYAAGMIDGDGSIQIQRISIGRFRLVVYLSGCNPAPLDELQSHWGGGITETTLRTGRQYFRWGLTSTRAANFLEEILPYLRGKFDQATLALKFQHDGHNAESGNTMKQTMSALSRKG